MSDKTKCVKVKFATEKDAVFYIDKLNKKSKRAVKPIRAYLCWCGTWHLSSKQSFTELKAEIEKLTKEKEALEKKIEQIQLIINSKN